LFNWRDIRLTWQVNRKSRAIFLLTFVSTLILPLEYSIYLGLGLSLILHLLNSSQNVHLVQLVPLASGQFRETKSPEALASRQITLLSVSGSLFHASLKQMEASFPVIHTAHQPILILRLRDQQSLGTTGIRLLQRIHQQIEAQGGRLLLVGIHPSLRVELQRSGMLDVLGEDNIFEETDIIFEATMRALQSAEITLKDLPPAPSESGVKDI
jgi:SulP family sulfate permease